MTDIPAEQVDVIDYAFANIADGSIALGDPYADIDRFYPGDSWDPDSLRGSFHQLQILKRNHPHLRTLISVGGWTGSGSFSDVALTPESREQFAMSCVDFVSRYGFDGVDIDWEFPVDGGLPGNTVRPEDKRNYTLLLAEIRSHLDAAGEYLLTIAAPSSPDLIDNIEADLIHPYVDWIDLMTYDFHGPWGGPADPVTHFNAPLRPAGDDPLGEPYRSAYNLQAAVDAYRARGVPAGKLHPGLAFYGRGYGGVASSGDGLYAAYSGASSIGTWEAGLFDYWDLAAHYMNQGAYSMHRHGDAAVPWLFDPIGRIMISYDDRESIGEKARFIRDGDLGGAMLWELSCDREGALSAEIREVFFGPETASSLPMGDMRRHPTAIPNPFTQLTTLRLDSEARSPMRVEIFDATGRRVARLNGREGRDAGLLATWDGRDDAGRPVAPGVYLYRAQGGTNLPAGRLVRLAR